MLKFRFFSLLVLSLITSACATNAERASEQMNTEIGNGIAAGISCEQSAVNNPKYIPIKQITVNENDYTIDQLANEARLTTSEAKLLTQWVNEIKPCRQLRMASANKISPIAGQLMAKGYAEQDEIYIALVKRNISWGQGLKALQQNVNQTKMALSQIDMQIHANLQNAHQAEIAQRQAAAAAAGAAMQQAGAQMQQNYYNQQYLNQNQQIINNMNRPRNTNCNAFGNNLNCTTY